MPTGNPWSKDEQAQLLQLIEKYGRSWTIIQWRMWAYGWPRRSKSSYERRYQRIMLLKQRQRSGLPS